MKNEAAVFRKKSSSASATSFLSEYIYIADGVSFLRGDEHECFSRFYANI